MVVKRAIVMCVVLVYVVSSVANAAGTGVLFQNQAISLIQRAWPVPDEDLPQTLFRDPPLITHLYTADPSAHVFNGKLYIYPSHDEQTSATPDEFGSHFDMRDYHVFSMDAVGGAVIDHGQTIQVGQIPWAQKQLWAPDAAHKDGKYYLYFPAKDAQGVFRIGVATSTKPEGLFEPQPEPIPGSYSIDPAVFEDSDGSYYLYVGGIRGGQLQHWRNGVYNREEEYPEADESMILPRMAKLSDDMLSLVHPLTDIQILDETGNVIRFGDTERHFFEAAWVHKYEGTYYLSWSTGESHNIQYATSDSPYGPFQWRGKILEPVLGWTNHHSVVEFKGRWYLFYHDSSLSGGKTHLRSIKMTELHHNEDGSIETIDAYYGDN